MCNLTDKAWQVRALCAVLLVLYDLIRMPLISPFYKIWHRLYSTVVPMTVVFSVGLVQQRCRSPRTPGLSREAGWASCTAVCLSWTSVQLAGSVWGLRTGDITLCRMGRMIPIWNCEQSC